MEIPFWQKGLNSEQERAVRQTEGPVLILAGAGSGKTKTLTHRIAYLVAHKNVSPENILAVTFTNKAAGEMRERIGRLLADGNLPQELLRRSPHVGTFHMLCTRILRREIAVFGYSEQFQIFDDQDQQSLMKQVMKSLEVDSDQIRPRALLEAISRAKNAFIDSQAYMAQAGSYFEEIVGKVYDRYQQELKRNNALDFDDLICFVVKIFQQYPETLLRYQKLFRYIMVDEYQDTNSPQYLFIHLLAAKERNIFVIGDDYQSIYGWRQADIRNILNFEKDYPDAVVITLDRNYRSTQVILDAAQGVIVRNRDQRHKKLWTEEKEGLPVSVCQANDEEAEARFVAETIVKAQSQGEHFKKFAVLYRTNAQSRALEEMFLRLNIQYRIVGGLKFYQRKEIKDMIGYLRFLQNPRDFLALERIINVPKRGIGKTTLAKWYQFSQARDQDFIESAYEIAKTAEINQAKRKTLVQFADFFMSFQTKLKNENESLSLLIQKIADESGYIQSLEDGTSEGETRKENVQELFSVAEKFKEESPQRALSLFLEEIALASDTDELQNGADAVQVMTIHSAKGLEFNTVFIVGLEEGIFPHSRSALSPQEMEEERRLMYVALTRAEKKVYLLYTESRTLYGNTQINPRSRFIDEIPEQLILEEDFFHGGLLTQKKRSFQSYAQIKTQPKVNIFSSVNDTHSQDEKFVATPVAELRPGDMIEHSQFGNGLIVAIDGSLVTIAFKRAGVKKMMLGVAPLRKL